MSNIHIITRTCDRSSIQSNRIVNKTECTLRCVHSVLRNMQNLRNVHYHIIDDMSSDYLRRSMVDLCVSYKQNISFNFLGPRETGGQNPHQASRHSVKVAYDYIYTLPDDDFVYIVDDDHLHQDNAISTMISAWEYLNQVTPEEIDVGIFPQCFVQLFPYLGNNYAHTYVRPCHVIPTPVGFYRTTWYTHETFMIKSKVFKKYKDIFDTLVTTGSDPAIWEGNTISNVWERDDFVMFMPLYPSVMHMSVSQDKPFYWSKQDVINLWETNKTPWSLSENSYIHLNEVIL